MYKISISKEVPDRFWIFHFLARFGHFLVDFWQKVKKFSFPGLGLQHIQPNLQQPWVSTIGGPPFNNLGTTPVVVSTGLVPRPFRGVFLVFFGVCSNHQQTGSTSVAWVFGRDLPDAMGVSWGWVATWGVRLYRRCLPLWLPWPWGASMLIGCVSVRGCLPREWHRGCGGEGGYRGLLEYDTCGNAPRVFLVETDPSAPDVLIRHWAEEDCRHLILYFCSTKSLNDRETLVSLFKKCHLPWKT